MGKKGGKKGKLDTAVQGAVPKLPTIVEEENVEKAEVPDKSDEKSEIHEEEHRKSRVSIKDRVASETRSKTLIQTEKSKSLIKVEKSKSGVLKENEERKSKSQVHIKEEEVSPVEEPEAQKEVKGKKGKKEKKDKPEDDAKPKKGKKGKKPKPEQGDGTEEAQDVTEPAVESPEDQATEKAEKKKKKPQGKKGKKGEAKETQKDEGNEEDLNEVLPSRPSRHESKMFEAPRTSTGDEEPRRSRRSTMKKRETLSRMDVILQKAQSQSSPELEKKEGPKKKKRRKTASRVSIAGGTDSATRGLNRGSLYTSKLTVLTDSSSESSEEVRVEKVQKTKKKDGKKEKKKKKKEADEEKEEQPQETEEEKMERKKAEKKAKLEAKKAARAAKKAAQKEAQREKDKKLGKKTSDLDVDDLKKKIEELKKIAKELGIEDIKGEGDEKKGPKKKMSKKEKAKHTAEQAEKAKQELEAQAKKLEEMIKKKKEEDRLAAIEKDKRETIEQGIRVEQLQVSRDLIQNLIDNNAENLRKEKELLEWKKYVECGKLPNPLMCDQMNTYLHLWGTVLEETSMEDASSRTTDAIKLLNDLDELIGTSTDQEDEEQELHKLENWKWVRQLFRDYQTASLDVATYRLLRNVEHNLNRINIPTANFNFKDDYVTLCLWLRVMLPIPLPNPRRPPKPRIDISFNLMEVSALFPLTIDCVNAAIRAMYLRYDHLSDLCETFYLPEVPKEYYMDLMTITKKEWRLMLHYKYKNRDKKPKPVVHEVVQPPEGLENVEGTVPEEVEVKPEPEEEKEDFESDEEIPLVPFKQLKPTPSDYATTLEDQLYGDTRSHLFIEVPEDVINLRKYVILGGVYHFNLLAQPPQPQDFITMEMTITGLFIPKKLETLPFKVVYTPYVPPEPEHTESGTSVRKLPEEIEEEMKRQEEELDKLIALDIKWPQHVIFLELPIVCRWDEEKRQWSKEEIHDLKHNEEKCILSFRTGVFGIYGLATLRYANLPFQAYEIKPEADESVAVQLTAAILMLEFNVNKEGLICITQLQNSPNMTMQDMIGKYMKLHKLKRLMKESGIDIFPAFDAFCYVDGCCEKQWAMEKHLYYNMAQLGNSFNFAWSRWNLQAGRRKIVLQMRQYTPEKGKQKPHQMLLVTPLKAAFIECTEVSQAFTDKELESKFSADLYHLMKNTSGIFVRNNVSKASKENVYTLAQFLISTRILSFS